MNYPFIPKSNKKLKAGDYWFITLSDKSFAVGIVIGVPPNDLKLTREIVVGLLNWNKKTFPEPEDLTNSEVLKQGYAHIKTIHFTGDEIIGNVDLNKSNITPLTMISSYGANSPVFHLMKGYKIIGEFNNSHRKKYEIMGYWGYDYIKEIAEQVFVRKNRDWH